LNFVAGIKKEFNFAAPNDTKTLDEGIASEEAVLKRERLPD